MNRQLTIYIKDDTYEELRVAAFEDRLSMAEIIRRSVMVYLIARKAELSVPPEVKLIDEPEVRLSDNGDDGLGLL